MKNSVLYSATFVVAVLAMLLFSSTSFAHSSFSHSRVHNDYQINTYVIGTRNGLARSYFNYSYDQRRARKLAKYYRTNNRALKKLHRYGHSHHNDHYGHYYDDCPYTDHRH